MDIYQDAKRRGISPPLFTDPEGDSCFSIYQIRWIKNAASLMATISSSETFTKRRAIFISVCKTVNSQGPYVQVHCRSSPIHSIVAYDLSLVLNPPLPMVRSILKITFLSRLMEERLGNKSHPASNQQAQASRRSEGVLDPGIF